MWLSKLRPPRWLVVIVVVIVIPGALYFVDHYFSEWFNVALALVAVPLLLFFALEHHFVPQPYRKMRKLHEHAMTAARQNRVLSLVYNDGVDQTRQVLEDIGQKRFTFPVYQEVPEISIKSMGLVDKRCILTFPIDESTDLVIKDTGVGPAHDYYRAIIDASQRLKANGAMGVTRVFIIKDDQRISPQLNAFIKRNISDGIEVKIVYESAAEPLRLNLDTLNFGCCECTDGSRWAMIVETDADAPDMEKRIHCTVDTNNAVVDKYMAAFDRILSESMGPEEINRLVFSPVNGDLWPQYFASSRFEMNPPHGLSAEDAGEIVRLGFKGTAAAEARVLVLGLTPKLLRALTANSVREIWSLDQCVSKPDEFPEVKFVTGNWLSPPSGLGRFNAIVFDEAINNITETQLPLFFEAMSDLLSPSGALVGRTLGRFDKDKFAAFFDMHRGDVIKRLKSRDAHSHDEVASDIVCLMHSRLMAYSEQSHVVSCERWNETIHDICRDGYCSEQERRTWVLPSTFQLYSPDQQSLHAVAREAGLALAELEPVRGAYAQTDASGFYRISRFTRLPTTA